MVGRKLRKKIKTIPNNLTLNKARKFTNFEGWIKWFIDKDEYFKG